MKMSYPYSPSARSAQNLGFGKIWGYITLPGNVTGLTLKNQIAWKTASLIHENVHMNYIVTDWSSALAGFLVSMLFGVSPGQS